MTRRKCAGAVLLAFIAAAAITTGTPAFADQHAPASNNLSDLLQQVRAARQAGSAANRERERAFIQKRDDRRRLLDDAKRRLSELAATGDRLEKQFNANELKLAELETLYRQRAGNFDQLAGVFSRAAADLAAQYTNSIAALGLEQRRAQLAAMGAQKHLPEAAQFDDLLLAFLELMTMQAANVRFESEVVLPGGEGKRRQVVRYGPFTATAGGDFLSYLAAEGGEDGKGGKPGQLFQLARHPASRYVNAAQSFATAGSGTDSDSGSNYFAAPIDPSRGAVLSLLVRAPSLAERVEQGGIVGYFILLIGAAGVLLGLERLWTLSRARRAVNRQRREVDNPRDTNPLGRVFAACAAERATDGAAFELLEIKLEDAVLRELPALERGLGAMKVFAAVAPLLGLLGTVTGMIETFQVITLFGTGDPKLMAGGISQALVTTALGLIVAVPILLLHTLAHARSRAIREILEVQSAGLLARHAEARA